MRPGGEVCDESGNCQIHFVVIICPPFLALVRYTMSCAGVFLILSQLVILVILSLFDLSLSMLCFVREHDGLLVAIMHCVTRDGFKVEDELTSGLKSSCRSYEALMHMSATDYCHVSFALELIMGLRCGLPRFS